MNTIVNKRNFATSKTEAINIAKEILRDRNNVKRLPYSTIKATSCSCYCGESLAMQVTTIINSKVDYEAVGVCENCGKNI